MTPARSDTAARARAPAWLHTALQRMRSGTAASAARTRAVALRIRAFIGAQAARVRLPARATIGARRVASATAAMAARIRNTRWLTAVSRRTLLPIWSWFLIALVVGCMVVLGWLTWKASGLVDESVQLQEDQIAAWEVANVQRQLLRLEALVAAANGRGRVRNAAQLRKGMGDAAAAAAALHHGPTERGLRRVTDWEPLLRRIEQILSHMREQIDPFITDPAGRGPLLLTGLREVSKLTEDLSRLAYTSNTRQATATMARLSQVQRYLLGVQVFLVLLLALLVLAVWFSLRARLQVAYKQIAHQRAVEAELRQAKEAAEEASRIKSDFLASMSHELRTPLTAMLGFCQLVLRGTYGKTTKAVREATEKVHHNGKLLLTLVNDVLDLSRIEANRLELELVPVDPVACVEDAIGRLEVLAQEKGLTLTAEPSNDLEPWPCDRRRITQVLLNLIGNAIKFTETGGIRVGVRKDGEELVYSVADTGIGIPRERIDNLFVEFQNHDAHIARDAPGAGLGLAISRRLVQLHKGRIWVESEPGKGTTFWFSLPAQQRSHGQGEEKEGDDPGRRGQRRAGPGDADVPDVHGV